MLGAESEARAKEDSFLTYDVPDGSNEALKKAPRARLVLGCASVAGPSGASLPALGELAAPNTVPACPLFSDQCSGGEMGTQGQHAGKEAAAKDGLTHERAEPLAEHHANERCRERHD